MCIIIVGFEQIGLWLDGIMAGAGALLGFLNVLSDQEIN